MPHLYREFSPPSPSPSLPLKSKLQGSNPSLKTPIPVEAQILASRTKSQPGGLDPSLEAQISASRSTIRASD